MRFLPSKAVYDYSSAPTLASSLIALIRPLSDSRHGKMARAENGHWNAGKLNGNDHINGTVKVNGECDPAADGRSLSSQAWFALC